MGNNMGSGSNKAAKVMKINGEFFKFNTPAKVIDITKDYPDHILLDSEEFLRFNLRAKPLNPEYQLKPRKIYLLVDLPKFPNNNLRRVQSSVLANTVTTRVSRRSVSDDLTIKTRSTVDMRSFDDDDDENGGSHSPVVGPTRVKMRLRKTQVEKIMEESSDDVEVAKKIVRLCLEQSAGGHVAEEEEERERRHYCLSVCGMCSPSSSYRTKYKKLTL